MFFHLSKVLFSGFHQFKGSFVAEITQNTEGEGAFITDLGRSSGKTQLRGACSSNFAAVDNKKILL